MAAVIVWNHRLEGIAKRIIIGIFAEVFMSVKFWRVRPFAIKCRTFMLETKHPDFMLVENGEWKMSGLLGFSTGQEIKREA